ncbi:MepB family protein [Zobellia laminariae]|uniref:MepB family protein n=1 Tax=Zobellia laminariae TaxID=248906 RepID=UPI003EF4E5B7
MLQQKLMGEELEHIVSKVYQPSHLSISNFELEEESRDYQACRFKLNTNIIICRNAKITPKKVGQFVTFWKRIAKGPISPFEESDLFNYFVINVSKGNMLGQFVFPKNMLVEKGIVSTLKKEGKRGFRVYPSWNKATSKQALTTQKWQLRYFYKIDDKIDLTKVLSLYNEF